MYDKFIGKRVRIKNCIKPCWSKRKIDVVGIVSYIGPNKLLGWPLQVTIERTVFQIDSIKQVRLEPPVKTILD